MDPLGHFKTITAHRHLVRRHCFQVGLYYQGLTHDLSKYSPTEFIPGAIYYEGGKRSPNNREREETGVSLAWLHHKGRNRHHLEYWIDYDITDSNGKMAGMRMPVNYVVEMFCDRVAASKIYRGDDYTDADPYEYFLNSVSHYLIHPDTELLLRRMLLCLKKHGEKKTFAYIRKVVLPKGYDCLGSRQTAGGTEGLQKGLTI